MSRGVTPGSAASFLPNRTSRFVSLPVSWRSKIRAAMRDFRQHVSYLGSPGFRIISA
jgi:hypothetical protein